MARQSVFTHPHLSFGLRQMFLWTATIALGLVALRSATGTLVAGMFALTFATLTASILFAVFRQAQKRAFWIGFTIFGWAYFLLLLVSWTLGRNTANDNPLRAANLVTQRLSSLSYHGLYDKAFERYQVSIPSGTYYGPMAGGGYVGSGMMSDDVDDAGMEDGSSDMMPGGGGSLGSGSASLGGLVPPPGPLPGPNVINFVNVAHALWTLLFAVIGGGLAQWLYMTGLPRSERHTSSI
jgi:hypothetical protein